VTIADLRERAEAANRRLRERSRLGSRPAEDRSSRASVNMASRPSTPESHTRVRGVSPGGRRTQCRSDFPSSSSSKVPCNGHCDPRTRGGGEPACLGNRRGPLCTYAHYAAEEPCYQALREALALLERQDGARSSSFKKHLINAHIVARTELYMYDIARWYTKSRSTSRKHWL
jgi:hypothetical protein